MSLARHALLLITIALALMLPCFLSGQVQAQTILVSRPWLVGGGPVVEKRIAEVEANVTSSHPITDVALYYVVVNGSDTPSLNVFYTPLRWNFTFGGTFNATYVWIMPHFHNNTSVWGYVRATNDHGETAGEIFERTFIYQSYTPNPNGTILRIDFRIRHIDPKHMTLNASVEARLTNYVNYQAEVLNSIGGAIPPSLTVNQPYGTFVYSSGSQFVTLYYWQGVPEMYPFDTYNFTYALLLPSYLNDTGRIAIVDIYGQEVSLVPGNTKEIAGVAPDSTLEEKQDNSVWDIHTYATFYPKYISSSGLVQISVTLERKAQQIGVQLLIPVASLFALLGISVLLRGPNELSNRLLLYLTVFVFAYGFQSNIRTLQTTPIVSGFSMIELMGLSLIPITVILSISSIMMNTLISARGPFLAIIWDAITVSLSEVVFYLIARVTVTYQFYYPHSITYTLANLGYWGWLAALFLGSGLVMSLLMSLQPEYRTRIRFHKADTDSKENHTHRLKPKVETAIASICLIGAALLLFEYLSGRTKNDPKNQDYVLGVRTMRHADASP